MPKIEVHQEISRNEEVWHKHLQFRSTPYFEPLIPIISRYLVENNCSGRLLDIGCGHAQKTYVFHKLGFEVTGIDGDSERIEHARAAYPGLDLRHFKFESNLPFEDNSFDIVFASSVFQYLDHDSVISECKRVLKKGGSIILIENLKNNPITRLGRAFLKLRKHKYQSYPWNHFTLKELADLGDQFDESSVQTFHLLSPIALPFRSKLLYRIFSSIDRVLVGSSKPNKFSWLALFMAKCP